MEAGKLRIDVKGLATGEIDVMVWVKNTGTVAHTFYVHLWACEGITGSYCSLNHTGNWHEGGSQTLPLAVGEEVGIGWPNIPIAGLLAPGTRYVMVKVYEDIGENICETGAYQTFVVTAPTVSASITSITVS